MMKINMMSKADMVKGQGVLSAHDEQVALAGQVLKGQFEVLNNAKDPVRSRTIIPSIRNFIWA